MPRESRIYIVAIANIPGLHVYRRRERHEVLDRVHLGQLAHHFQILTGDVDGVVDAADFVYFVDFIDSGGTVSRNGEIVA